MVDGVSQSTQTTQTTKKTSFFKKVGKGIGDVGKSIGNWFNKNGNTVGTVSTILGDTAMQTGMSLAQIQMLKSGSIWRMGYMGMGYMGMPMGYGMDFFSGADPLGVSGWMGYGMNGYNPYMTYMGTQMAYNWGAQLMDQHMMQQQAQYSQYNQYYQQQTVQNIQADFAELDVSSQDTQDGENLDEGTNALVKDGKAVDGKTFSLGVTKGADKAEDAANYSARLQELGKSYLAHIDSTVGNSDGAISLEEYTEHEMKKVASDATDAQKAQMKQDAQTAFKNLDVNADGKLDWKEYSAALTTFDQKYGGSEQDGVITSEDYEKWSADLANPDPNTNKFGRAVRTNYLTLFKKTKPE